METTSRTIPARKRIALVAHDHMKSALMEWVSIRKEQLIEHELFGTGTTGTLVAKATGIDVSCMLSGPMGGDQQLGAKIAEGKVDMMIFFWDPLDAVPHDPDVKALLRLAAVWNIPVACNPASADFLIESPLLNCEYETRVPDYANYLKKRT
ncbi:methylglyoxal synthase [Echinimonas agarilytica]|uniref:Methylglyoxal synthase n=1 Tax=Echinimonas agarilytica TaxID=1215918 RepID=A0AA42B9A4_9GAMM|nr:methylglyoxal synthase [Echinimonas agarilytica]MCM2681352.1 methylglyoxal synthase [Echinimonas agarilytica]